MRTTMSKQEILEKIKCSIVEEGDCWIWSGRITERGYPMVHVDGMRASQSVRRVALFASGERLPKGVPVTMKCGNRLCVNPACCVKTTWTGVRNDYYQSDAYDSAAKLARSEKSRKRGASISMNQKVRDNQVFKVSSASVFNPVSVLGL